MSDPNPKTCPVCGGPMDSAKVSGCPQCLMRAAMQPTAQPGGDARHPAPSVESVAAAFPQLEILELIGQGGMGCVFKARQPKLNRLVALKLLPASLTERDAAFAGRFEREGQLLARLHHPNIVAVHDSGTAGDFFYLIMEYVDGVNLRQAMRARRFTPGQALAIVPHICDALQFAHDEGVLHRDIKPENILLDAKGRVKLADFGIAKLLGSDADTPVRDSIAQAKVPGLTQSGTALGTPSYMSPEQRESPADVDHRADIYSLGVVFYELLTGELPQGSLARPSEKSDADPRVDAIVQQALEHERTRRQGSACEVKTQIEDLSTETPKPGRTPQTEPARFSRAAFVGAIWALGGALHFMFPEMGYRYRSEFIPYTMMAIGWSALLGATILGWVAVSQIRRSSGRLLGIRLALFAGLYIPLIVVAGLIAWALRTVGYDILGWSEISSPLLKSQFTFVLSVLSLIAWFFIIRAAARKLCPSPDASEKPAHPLLPTILLQAALFAVVSALAHFVVQKFAAIFADMAVALPPATQLIFETARIWGLLLFPLMLIVGASGCFVARELGGRRGLRQWTIAVIVVLVSVVALSSAALWLPMRKLMVEFNSAPAQSLVFGPVIERVLPFDRYCIDFQSGSVMRPDYEKFGVDGADWEPWIQQTGADAMVEESAQPGFEPPAPNDHGFPRLVALKSRRGDRESCVFVGEETDDFDSVRPNDADARLKIVTERDLYWGLANGSHPWWFRTRDGAKDVLQILGTSDVPRGLKIRYKLVQGVAVKSAQNQDGPLGYAAVVETTLPDGEMIDFDTGKIVSWADMPQFPKDRTFNEDFWTAFANSAAGVKDTKAPARQTDDKERDVMMFVWMQQNGLDAFFEMHDDKNLLNLGMTVVPMQSENWDKLTAYHLHHVLAQPPESRVPLLRLPAEGIEMPGPANGTRAILWSKGFPTYAFRTREGGEGLLQISGYGKERRNLKLRYKLTSAAFQKQLTAPASFESVTGGAHALFTMIIPHPADIGVTTEDEFTAQHATQEFEIHTQFKTGEVAQKAEKQTGPSAEGFMLTVQRLKAPLVSAAADLPQSFDRPYWKSYVNSSFDPKTGQGVAVYFDFGARLDPDFKRAMLELLQLRDGMVHFTPVQAKPPAKEEPWGEAVDGVQASLRADREEWWKGEIPALKLRVRNQGENRPFVARQQEVAEVEFDGQWFMYSGPVDVLSGPIQPGEYFDNIAVVLDPKSWQSKETHEPLALKAGEHTVRVSMGLEVKPSVRVISNPIKINLRATHEPLPPPPPIPPAALEQAKAAQVDLIFYDKGTDGTYRRLTLHAGNFDGPGSEPWDRVPVSAEQLARVLDHLAQTRFFDTAKEYDSLEVAKRQPCYILKVRQHGHEYFENLGWGRQTGERLEKLRNVLEGDANAAMSKLLAALEPKLREWEDASWSAIQNGLQLRVEAERPICKVGDNVNLFFTFKNTTDRPFTVLDAQDQMRGTFHQFTFTDEKGGDIAQTSTPDPAWENKGIGEIMVRHEIPAHDMIGRTVALSGWNLAGLGHPYTGIGKEARSFNVTGAYFTRVGLDLKDPKVWLGEIAAKPVRIEIVKNHPLISAASQTADSSPADLAAASARGKVSATADIKAGRLRILYSGIPWSQGKPLFDDTTGYRVELLGGCVETSQFRAELDAYNQTMHDWRKQH